MVGCRHTMQRQLQKAGKGKGKGKAVFLFTFPSLVPRVGEESSLD